MKTLLLLISALLLLHTSYAQKPVKIKKKDRKRDVLIQTNYGDMTIRLSDSTPLHRDNFIRLVKQHYFDSILFHRVIQGFMIQAGDPTSKTAPAGKPLGNGGPDYTVPAEFVATLYHKKGMLSAARTGDDINPKKESSGSQFYIVQGKTYTDAGLDSLETYRLKRKLEPAAREVYKTVGGTPTLDHNYTVYGEVIKGTDVIDKIAAVPTSKGPDRDRPLTNVVIIKSRLVKRKK